MLRIKRGIIATAASLVLFSASPAFAQTTSNDGYNDFGGRVEANVSGDNGGGGGDGGGGDGAAGTNSAEASDRLPFTGTDLGLIAGAGIVLLGLGLGVRRLIGSPESA